MDPNYRIYQDDPDKIPAEDKTRLEGFLRGQAEAHKDARKEEEIDQLIAEIERRKDRPPR